MRNLESLTQQEILALAIALEEDDERAYSDYAARLRPAYPASADVFYAMKEEEAGHRTRLIQLYRERFGEHIPLIRREDIRGFVRRPPLLRAGRGARAGPGGAPAARRPRR